MMRAYGSRGRAIFYIGFSSCVRRIASTVRTTPTVSTRCFACMACMWHAGMQCSDLSQAQCLVKPVEISRSNLTRQGRLDTRLPSERNTIARVSNVPSFARGQKTSPRFTILETLRHKSHTIPQVNTCNSCIESNKWYITFHACKRFLLGFRPDM